MKKLKGSPALKFNQWGVSVLNTQLFSRYVPHPEDLVGADVELKLVACKNDDSIGSCWLSVVCFLSIKAHLWKLARVTRNAFTVEKTW